MRPAQLTLAAIAAAVAAAGPGAAPALADGITVWPSAPLPGERIHISVAGCSVGPAAHVARSDAFTGPVTLYGKGDTGEGDPRLKAGLRPGRYGITASCDGHAVRGEVVVTAAASHGPGGGPPATLPGATPGATGATGGGPPAVHTEGAPTPTGSPATTIGARPAAAHGRGGGSDLAYWLSGGVIALAAGAALLALRRRTGR